MTDATALAALQNALNGAGGATFIQAKTSQSDLKKERENPGTFYTNIYASFTGAPAGYTVHFHVSQAISAGAPLAANPGTIEHTNLKRGTETTANGNGVALTAAQLNNAKTAIQSGMTTFFQTKKNAVDKEAAVKAKMHAMETANPGKKLKLKANAAGTALFLGDDKLYPGGAVHAGYTDQDFKDMITALSAKQQFYNEYNGYVHDRHYSAHEQHAGDYMLPFESGTAYSQYTGSLTGQYIVHKLLLFLCALIEFIS